MQAATRLEDHTSPTPWSKPELFANRSAAFVDLLGDGGAAYVERERLTAFEAIGLHGSQGA